MKKMKRKRKSTSQLCPAEWTQVLTKRVFQGLFLIRHSCAAARRSVLPQRDGLFPDALLGHNADLECVPGVHVPLGGRDEDVLHKPHGSVQGQRDVLYVLHVLEADLVGQETGVRRPEGTRRSRSPVPSRVWKFTTNISLEVKIPLGNHSRDSAGPGEVRRTC